MGLVQQLVPLNLAEERDRFFAANGQYQPQFQYDQEFAVDELEKWGHPQPAVVELAERLLTQHDDVFLQREPYPAQVVADKCRALLNEVGVTEDISISFDPHKLTRCSITGSKIVFRDPPDFMGEADLQGMLNHELQTHLLRNLNQKKQGWQIDRARFDHLLLRTEEGLAVLHGLMPFDQPSLWRPASYYLAVAKAQVTGFSQVFAFFVDRGFNPTHAWRLAARVKRGLTDTSQPGGNTKDLCYLEGVLKVWQWLLDDAHDPRQLYLGKIYIEELADKQNQVVTPDVYLPTFMRNLDTYRHQIRTIGEYNKLTLVGESSL